MLTLGTDGFGLSDTRPAARRHFLVDAESISVGALAALARRGEVEKSTVAEAAAQVPHRRCLRGGPADVRPGRGLTLGDPSDLR